MRCRVLQRKWTNTTWYQPRQQVNGVVGMDVNGLHGLYAMSSGRGRFYHSRSPQWIVGDRVGSVLGRHDLSNMNNSMVLHRAEQPGLQAWKIWVAWASPYLLRLFLVSMRNIIKMLAPMPTPVIKNMIPAAWSALSLHSMVVPFVALTSFSPMKTPAPGIPLDTVFPPLDDMLMQFYASDKSDMLCTLMADFFFFCSPGASCLSDTILLAPQYSLSFKSSFF